LRLAGASSLLNAVTSENTRQATRLLNMGDVSSVGMVIRKLSESSRFANLRRSDRVRISFGVKVL